MQKYACICDKKKVLNSCTIKNTRYYDKKKIFYWIIGTFILVKNRRVKWLNKDLYSSDKYTNLEYAYMNQKMT